jgi:hypothetical protein
MASARRVTTGNLFGRWLHCVVDIKICLKMVVSIRLLLRRKVTVQALLQTRQVP